MMLTTLLAPPEKASSGCSPNCSRIFGSVVRALRTGPTRSALAAVEHDDEPRDAALDDLLVDDVGLVEPDERLGLGRVLHLDREHGTVRRFLLIADGDAGEGTRRGWLVDDPDGLGRIR